MKMKLKSIAVAGMMCAAGAVMAGDVYPYGVCAHVTRKEGEPYFLKQTLNAMELAGIRYVRSDIDTGAIRRKDGTYDFSRYDRIVSALAARGMKLFPIIYGRNWPHPPRTAEEMDAYREYVRAIVTHYKDKFDAVELWNEANHHFFWKGDAVDYARMLKAGYETIKSVNPNIKVVFTGTAGVPHDWIRKVLESGAANSFDVMNVHPYVYPDPPEGNFEADIEKLSRTLAEFGRKDAKIWFTEIGWPTHDIKGVPFVHVLLAGLKVARPDQNQWNIVIADTQSEGEVNQRMAEAMTEVLPVGSTVRACSQAETCKALAAGGVDAVVYPFDDSFPADTIDAVNDFIAKGGVLVDLGGLPCYFGLRGSYRVPGMQNGHMLSRFPFGYRAWWWSKHGEFPKETYLWPTQCGLDSGIKPEPAGFKVNGFLAPDRIGSGSEWIPLIAGKTTNGVDLVGAAAVRYKGDRKGAAVLATMSMGFGGKGSNTEEEQACFTARAMGISFAAGVEAYFPYNLRAFETDPYYREDHFGLMHANFQPKPAFSAYANFTRERPAGSVQKMGAWHDEKYTLYYPQWIKPDGVKVGMIWTAGADVERTIRFNGNPTFRNIYGRKIAVREVEKGVYKLKLTGSPVYFSGAELAGL